MLKNALKFPCHEIISRTTEAQSPNDIEVTHKNPSVTPSPDPGPLDRPIIPQRGVPHNSHFPSTPPTVQGLK